MTIMAIETSPELQPTIMRVLVGSHAHGMARPDSDYDYREVFVIPTSTILSLGRNKLSYAWQTQNKHTDDEGGYEISEWLNLCLKGAPNAVEMCYAPFNPSWALIASDNMPDDRHRFFGTHAQDIGRKCLTFEATRRGILGYATNSWRKIPERPEKWKAGMLRTLYQGYDLLLTGSMSLVVPETGWGATVRKAAANQLTDGEVIDIANSLIHTIEAMTVQHSALPHSAPLGEINSWLLDLRRTWWD